MALKHTLDCPQAEERLTKRANSRSTSHSRSVTPAVTAFSVQYIPSDVKGRPPKKKNALVHLKLQASPFVTKGRSRDAELDQYYTITPSAEWESMKKYTNFIIQGEVYKVHHYVYVRGEDTPKGNSARDKDFWIARILQVRAASTQHVYALVAWLYWPEELPRPEAKTSDTVNSISGQRKYHGSHELIASNCMQVLNVLTFAGKADVSHWDEEDDNLRSKLYWRQTFCRETEKLSDLRMHCICDGYFNPEVAMMICDNEKCKLWMHQECLIDDVLTKTHDRSLEGRETKLKGASNSAGRSGKSGRKIWQGQFAAKFHTDDSASGPHSTMVISDLRDKSAEPTTWTERITCLKCRSLLD